MQRVLGDAGLFVTSLAIDSKRIVVGTVKPKINVFSAVTGLYARPLLGHHAGVWCLTLISRSGKGAERAAVDHILPTDYDKDKMAATSSEDGSGGKPHQAAANVALLRVHHDPRSNPAKALLHPTHSSSCPMHQTPLEQGARRVVALTIAGHPSDSPAASSVQRNLQRDAFASGAGNSDADICIVSYALPSSAESYAPPPGLDPIAKTPRLSQTLKAAPRCSHGRRHLLPTSWPSRQST
ncbi:uncharacterized protein PSANT_07092 [Moesziomyces antarcticus]|uniref:Uncharacterized protein n=1 Tax=Pseudozyma antarctica TaxID=84753 RepID=A0A5C3G0K9_PSEA2|nr:uncharacterized protein PSANT_06987 [Moesziomyces antarcticus]SPO49399.1 uncharacterized protein PSANT_07092 [Moesziomyces antarcticus]